ncbi:glucose-6-phosphate dehydrogenase [soil metagenome]
MTDPTLTTAHDPSVIVIFGITGDLARNKVLPAIYHLFKSQLISDHSFLVGTSRHETTTEHIVDTLKQTIISSGEEADEAVLAQLTSHLTMIQLDPETDEHYIQLKEHLQQLEDSIGTCLQQFFYLSIPPQVFGTIVDRLGKHGLNHGCSHGTTTSRLLIEKPFGYDSDSAKELIAHTAQYFDEAQLFRIDHYLAKETAQNILTFRKQNPLFSHIWNNKHITKISITAAEAIGIEGRANFYDQVGALRDSVQSHLMQLLSLTLMDVPEEMNATTVHEAKQAVLDALQPVPADLVNDRAVRGQYSSYRQEVGNPDTATETYASVVLFSEDPKWQGVPLKLTNGKALRIKRTSITIDFGEAGVNRLQFRIQPNEGITLTLQVKQPGLATEVSPTSMEFDYQTAFKFTGSLDAYERVLIEAMRGDHTLFATDKEVLAAWNILQPVIDAWQGGNEDMTLYESGSDGPDVTKLSHT